MLNPSTIRTPHTNPLDEVHTRLTTAGIPTSNNGTSIIFSNTEGRLWGAITPAATGNGLILETYRQGVDGRDYPTGRTRSTSVAQVVARAAAHLGVQVR